MGIFDAGASFGVPISLIRPVTSVFLWFAVFTGTVRRFLENHGDSIDTVVFAVSDTEEVCMTPTRTNATESFTYTRGKYIQAKSVLEIVFGLRLSVQTRCQHVGATL